VDGIEEWTDMDIDDLTSILAPPAKRSLADEVTQSIREAIPSGKLAPGERLREELLAKTMNVSRGPVREALNQLEREGLVLVQRNRGTFVARLSLEDLDEVYTLRLPLERLAVQRTVRYADEAQLNEMQAVVDAMVATYERGITELEAAELDVRFHEILYQASQHRRLYECWANLRPQIHILLLTRNVVASDFREMVVSSHQAILDAIRARDEERAVAVIEDHLNGSYERVARSYRARAREERREAERAAGVDGRRDGA
jgi:DNA-binding GntR family transcriptional regulator